MKMFDGIDKLFILAAAIIIILWLLLDNRCNHPSPISERPLKDSIIRALDSAEKRWKHREDSLKQVTYFIERRADSFRVLKTEIDSQLRVSTDRSVGLAAEVKRLMKQGHNDQALEKCDSLADAIVGLRFSLSYQKWITDSLLQAKDQIIAAGESRISIALEFNRRMRKSVDSVSTLYDDLDKRYMKTSRKAAKKYALSLSVGYGIGTTADPQPFVGVTFGRTLIRF